MKNKIFRKIVALALVWCLIVGGMPTVVFPDGTDAGAIGTSAVAQTTYTITCSEAENGTVTADKTTAVESETITLTATPNNGYRFKEWQVVSENVNIENNQFTMPAEDVTITAVFERVYTISIASDIQNGKVTADKSVAAEGELVTLTVTPDGGYEIATYTIGVEGYVSVSLSGNTFTMPACNVTVSVKFQDASAHKVMLPANPGYTVRKTDETISPIPDGGTYAFTVTIWDGYEKTENFYVYERYSKRGLTPDENGVYTISDVHGDLWIGVNGVRPLKPKSAEDFTGDNLPFMIICSNDADHRVNAPYYAADYATLGEITGSTGSGCYLDVTFNVKDYFESICPEHNSDGLPETAAFQTKWMVNEKKWAYVNAATQYTVTCAPAAYAITYATTENGSVTGAATATAGETVTLTVTPVDGYELDALTVTDAKGGSVAVNNNAFTMPAGNVSVSATFKSTVSAPSYIITIPSSVNLNDNQTLTITVSDAANLNGKEIVVNVTSENDFMLVNAAKTHSISYYGNNAKTFTFTQNGSFDLGMIVGDTAGKPAGTYEDTLTFTANVQTVSAGD